LVIEIYLGFGFWDLEFIVPSLFGSGYAELGISNGQNEEVIKIIPLNRFLC